MLAATSALRALFQLRAALRMALRRAIVASIDATPAISPL